MTDSEAVRRANDDFYRAFESLEHAAMKRVWLHSVRVQCTHPGWRRLVGYPVVIESWQRIFQNTIEMRFDLTAVEVNVSGDMAWVVCTENITAKTLEGPSVARVEATNVFERHGGRWLLVHHHGSPVLGSEDEPTPALQ